MEGWETTEQHCSATPSRRPGTACLNQGASSFTCLLPLHESDWHLQDILNYDVQRAVCATAAAALQTGGASCAPAMPCMLLLNCILALCAGKGTTTNTLLDPYGLPSNKNNKPGGFGK